MCGKKFSARRKVEKSAIESYFPPHNFTLLQALFRKYVKLRKNRYESHSSNPTFIFVSSYLISIKDFRTIFKWIWKLWQRMPLHPSLLMVTTSVSFTGEASNVFAQKNKLPFFQKKNPLCYLSSDESKIEIINNAYIFLRKIQDSCFLFHIISPFFFSMKSKRFFFQVSINISDQPFHNSINLGQVKRLANFICQSGTSYNF